jgi:hypothetical protein
MLKGKRSSKAIHQDNSWWKNMAMIPVNFSQTSAVNSRIVLKFRNPAI